jgi:formylglycine-generating enzyme required for sulfatase activity
MLLTALNAAREETDKLFSVIRSGSIYERPVPQRHRLIFYLGHLEAFDWNKIGAPLSGSRFNPEFDKLFEAGIDPDSKNLPSDKPYDWPSLFEVQTYRTRVRRELNALLPRADEHVVTMAVEHRLMHAETLAYLMHSMRFEHKSAPGLGPMPVSSATVEQPITIPAGPATLGRKRGASFGWDNEYEEHQVDVPRFCIDRHKVTNGQYLAFVRQGAPPPHFWTEEQGRWCCRGMFSLMTLALDAPVYVTQSEASAYARWVGKELPTEAQFHRAAYGTRSGKEREYPWGSSQPHQSHGNFNFYYWDPISVNATPAGDSDFGVSQLVGNGWEWTRTVFRPFPGFKADPNYPGYSANFFDGEHYVMKGASPRTAACFLRRSFRNWFRPDYPYVYTTFRCVEN